MTADSICLPDLLRHVSELVEGRHVADDLGPVEAVNHGVVIIIIIIIIIITHLLRRWIMVWSVARTFASASQLASS